MEICAVDTIHIELTTDQSIVNTGMQMLEAVRHLCQHLMPTTKLLRMSLIDAAEPVVIGQSESQVVVVRNERTGTVLFALHGGHAVLGMADHDALQLISDCIREERFEEKTRSYRVTGSARRQPPANTPSTKPILTTRQMDVLGQLMVGKTDHKISEHLGMSHWAVRYHLKQIYAKLGVKRRGEAIRWALEDGWCREK
jgi:DNA-binding CsgD family transcriptional regulator